MIGHSAVTGIDQDLIPIKRVLISVYDKTNIVELATILQHKYNIELISTGGTANILRESGLIVYDVSKYTHSPEMLHGRVKTLHPIIHGGLLAVRGNIQDEDDIKKYNIPLIDLVITNLYPFDNVIKQLNNNVTLSQAIENIDIGGVTLIRASAKNYKYVGIITHIQQYDSIINELNIYNGSLTLQTRYQLSINAFNTTAIYDTTIANYLAKQSEIQHDKSA